MPFDDEDQAFDRLCAAGIDPDCTPVDAFMNRPDLGFMVADYED